MRRGRSWETLPTRRIIGCGTRYKIAEEHSTALHCYNTKPRIVPAEEGRTQNRIRRYNTYNSIREATTQHLQSYTELTSTSHHTLPDWISLLHLITEHKPTTAVPSFLTLLYLLTSVIFRSNFYVVNAISTVVGELYEKTHIHR